jgi:hypothetical protein
MATRPFLFFQTRLALSFSFEEDEQSRRGQTAFLVLVASRYCTAQGEV